MHRIELGMVRVAVSNDNRKKRRKSGAHGSAAMTRIIQDLYGSEATLLPSIQPSQSSQDDGNERKRHALEQSQCHTPVCTENLSPDVVVMKSTKDRI